MKRIVITLGLFALVINNAFAIPTVVETSSAGTTIKFTAKLNERLPSGYKVKIDYGNGKGFVPMTCSVLTCTLSTNVLPQGFPYVPYSVGIYNASGILQGQINQGTYGIFGVVTTTAQNLAIPTLASNLNDTGITTCSNANSNDLSCPVEKFSNQDAQFGRDFINNDDSDGHAGFSFTKISSTGESLPASALIWNCVKDNVTGLIWEVKTTDNGLHDYNYTYTWYEPDSSKNGGSTGTQNGGACSGSQCDTNAYVNAVNSESYCGYKDWRMPTTEELLGIVSLDRYNPAIDMNYFPNTKPSWYWASTAFVTYSFNSWRVDFGYGGTGINENQNSHHVRLVRK